MVWHRETAALRVGIGLLGALMGGCFVGDAANGLLCAQDDDCGLGVSCALDAEANQMCCGGLCNEDVVVGTGSTSVSTTDPSASMSSTDTSTSTSTTSTTTVAESTTMGGFCGDDELDPGEECDNGANSNCVDCEYEDPCGNGSLNPGELCDVWGDQADVCSEECGKLVLFEWTTGTPGNTLFCDETELCSGWAQNGDGAFLSGPYLGGDETVSSTQWPEALLTSRPFAIPDVTDADGKAVAFDLVIRVEHSHGFNEIDGGVQADHGLFLLAPVDTTQSSWLRLAPTAGVGPGVGEVRCGEGDVDGSCVEPEKRETEIAPFCDIGDPTDSAFNLGFVGDRESGEAPTVARRSNEGGAITPGSYRFAARLRYDCVNATMQSTADDDAWSISSVEVWLERRDDR
ncbi:MAG: hypothetical protein AAGA54_06100 [Myxococcota bacterium]